jgi:uncharacterized oligopeptide transporter (OPT) family protein
MEGGAVSTAFIVLALICVACGIAAAMMIASFLSKRGVKINYLFIRLFIFGYVRQYRQVTIEESGKPGPLFYMFVTSWVLALVFAVVVAILGST